MAKGTGDSSGEDQATTLIFPKKSSWDELVEARAAAKKRSSSANGTFSKVLQRLVQEEHMDRRAAKMLIQLDSIEDDEDLHVTLHHLMDGIKKRGILKRAMAVPDFFDKPDGDTMEKVAAAGARAAKGAKGKGKKDDAKAAGANVHSIAEARRTGEEAGGAAAGA